MDEPTKKCRVCKENIPLHKAYCPNCHQYQYKLAEKAGWLQTMLLSATLAISSLTAGVVATNTFGKDAATTYPKKEIVIEQAGDAPIKITFQGGEPLDSLAFKNVIEMIVSRKQAQPPLASGKSGPSEN